MRLHAVLLSLLLVPASCLAAGPESPAAPASATFSDKRAARTAEEVKGQFMHAWRGYREHAWGHDALKPLSNTAHDWYGESLLMTPVDALDTMILMGLDDEAREAQNGTIEVHGSSFRQKRSFLIPSACIASFS